MLKLPEKHRAFFMDTLHEHTSLSAPTKGSDSLVCYQHLYALHFSNQEYLKAAIIAYTLYTALNSSLKQFILDDTNHTEGPESFACIQTGDCFSNPCDVPRRSSMLPFKKTLPLDQLPGFNMYAKALDHVWPLLEQQRSALLMLISALSLTQEKMVLIPPSHHGISFSSAPHTGDTPRNALGPAFISPSQLPSFRQWFSDAE